MSALSDPNLAFVILILGGLCIYVEFSASGLIVPGILGAILALLGLSAMSVLPINWMAAGLVVVGLACFVLETKFISHGILGTGGVIALVLGALFLIDGPPEIRIRAGTALGVALPFGVITCFLVALVVRSRRNKVVGGPSGLVNQTGVSVTDLSPAGKIQIGGEYWSAVSTHAAPRGTTVRVLEINDLFLKVTPIQEASTKE